MERSERPPKTSGSEQPIPGRCGAKLKRTDPPRYCTRWPVRGRNRCHWCGGKTPVAGPTHPTFKHGRYSSVLRNTPLGADFDASLQDPNLLSIEQDVAVLEALWMQAARALQSGETPGHWKRLVKLRDKFKSANTKIQEALREQQAENEKPEDERSLPKLNQIDERITAARKKASESLNAIIELIGEGAVYQERVEELLRLTREKVELKRAESRRLVELGLMMSAKEVMSLMVAIESIIAARVADQKVKSAIALDMRRLIAPAGSASREQHEQPQVSSGQVIDGKATPAPDST